MSYTGPSNTTSANQTLQDFSSLQKHLTATYSYPLTLSAKKSAHDPSLSNTIASLHIHPALESLLHILNNDLASAHFLCRHMQSPPAWEAMLIHGVLHRVEGDYDNANAWYGNVEDSDVFRATWPQGLGAAKEFLDQLRVYKKALKDVDGSLHAQGERELKALIEFCKQKFGLGVFQDGTKAWVEPSEEIRQAASKQLVGGEGWRQF